MKCAVQKHEETSTSAAALAWAVAATAVLGCVSCKTDSTDDASNNFWQPAADRTTKESANPAARPIAVGDRLELFVEEDDSFNGIYSVRENGDVIVPRVGRIKVVDISPSAAERRIASALEGPQLLKATVMVDRLVSEGRGIGEEVPEQVTSIYLTGKVEKVGMHRIPSRSGSVLGAYEALLIAGGISRFGDDRKSYILRNGSDGKRHRIPLDIRAISAGEIADIPVQEGDIISVPERVWGW